MAAARLSLSIRSKLQDLVTLHQAEREVGLPIDPIRYLEQYRMIEKEIVAELEKKKAAVERLDSIENECLELACCLKHMAICCLSITTTGEDKNKGLAEALECYARADFFMHKMNEVKDYDQNSRTSITTLQESIDADMNKLNSDNLKPRVEEALKMIDPKYGNRVVRKLGEIAWETRRRQICYDLEKTGMGKADVKVDLEQQGKKEEKQSSAASIIASIGLTAVTAAAAAATKEEETKKTITTAAATASPAPRPTTGHSSRS